MFIYSFKASSIKFFGILCVAMAALITLIAFVPAYAGGDTQKPNASGGLAVDAPEAESGVTVSVRYDKVKTADDAAKFLGQFGWVVDAGSVEKREVTIPSEFDKVFAGYNEMQKSQGLDLSKYKKKNGITSDAGACLQLIVRQLDALDNTEVMLDIVRRFSVDELNQLSEQGMTQLKVFVDNGTLPK